MIRSFLKLPVLLFFFFALVMLVFFSTRGIVYSDEGYILHTAERILDGQVPYRDFHFVYTPLSAYITAVTFLLFGKSILLSRLLMVFFSLITSAVLFILFQKITKNLFITLLGVSLYMVWAPIHVLFPWPVLFSITFSIISCYFLLTSIETKQVKLLFYSGIFIFLVFLSKQNFGVILPITYLLSLFFISFLRKKEAIVALVLGVCLPAFIYLCYLIFTNSLTGFINDFYVYTLQRIIIENTLSTPFLYGDNILSKIAKFFFYTSPFLLGGFAAVFCYLRKRDLIFLPIFVCLFYLIGIRPTTDYIHLAPILSLLSVPIVTLWETVKNIKLRVGILLTAFVFVFLGIYSAIYIGYYRWEPPLHIQNQFLSIPKTAISVDSFHKDELEELVNDVNKKTNKTDSIFVYGYSPMLYFIADRSNPTAFDLFEPNSFYANYEKDMVSILSKKQVKLIITIKNPPDSFLGEYIKKEYNKTDMIHDLYVWERKEK